MSASAILTSPGPFRVEMDGSGNAGRWKAWCRKFATYCTAAQIKDDSLKLATFLNIAGDDIDEIVQALAKDASASVETIQAIIASHFEASRNTDKLVITFRSTRQHRTDESVEAFMIRLRRLAEDCGFASFDDELRLQLAVGARDPKVMQRAMEKQTTLDYLYNYARQLEAAKSDSTRLLAAVNQDAPPLPPIPYQNQSRNRQHQQKQTHEKDKAARAGGKRCGACGRAAHVADQKCPAEDKYCSGCGGKGHFRPMCHSATTNTTHNATAKPVHTHVNGENKFAVAAKRSGKNKGSASRASDTSKIATHSNDENTLVETFVNSSVKIIANLIEKNVKF